MDWTIHPKSQAELNDDANWQKLNESVKGIANTIKEQPSTVQEAERVVDHIISLAAQEALSHPMLGNRITGEARKIAGVVIDIAKKREEREATEIVRAIYKAALLDTKGISNKRNIFLSWAIDIHKEQYLNNESTPPHLKAHIEKMASSLSRSILHPEQPPQIRNSFNTGEEEERERK